MGNCCQDQRPLELVELEPEPVLFPAQRSLVELGPEHAEPGHELGPTPVDPEPEHVELEPEPGDANQDQRPPGDANQDFNSTPDGPQSAPWLPLGVQGQQWGDADNPQRNWPVGIGSMPNLFLLMTMISRFMPLRDMPLQAPAAGPDPSAVDVVRSIKQSMQTNILATVRVGGWVTTWATSLIALIGTAVTECKNLRLVALKGGRACDEELVLIYWIAHQFGFRPVDGEFNLDQTRDGANQEDLFFTSKWRADRANGKSMGMILTVVGSPAKLALEQSVAPRRSCAQAPNLGRVAVVSCPEQAATGLNEHLGKQLNKAMERARAKGFASERNWKASEEANRVYREYFDLERISLADLGVTPTG